MYFFKKNLVDAINCYECIIRVYEDYEDYNEDTCLAFGDNTPTTNCAGQNYCLNAYGKGEGGYEVEYHGCGHGLPDAVNVRVKGAFFLYRRLALFSRQALSYMDNKFVLK